MWQELCSKSTIHLLWSISFKISALNVSADRWRVWSKQQIMRGKVQSLCHNTYAHADTNTGDTAAEQTAELRWLAQNQQMGKRQFPPKANYALNYRLFLLQLISILSQEWICVSVCCCGPSRGQCILSAVQLPKGNASLSGIQKKDWTTWETTKHARWL